MVSKSQCKHSVSNSSKTAYTKNALWRFDRGKCIGGENINTIKVSIRLVDGGLSEFTKGEDFLYELQSLQSQGFTGKQLIHRLITDDWAAPPVVVEISGKGLNGESLKIQIPYR